MANKSKFGDTTNTKNEKCTNDDNRNLKNRIYQLTYGGDALIKQILVQEIIQQNSRQIEEGYNDLH